jgi:hypothetical protein
MPLEYLQIMGTQVKDLAALRGMPLTSVGLLGCTALTDLSPLADCKELQNITLPPNATDIELFRAFPKLTRIGFGQDPKSTFPKLTRIGFWQDPKSTWLADKTAAEFWQEYDAKKKRRRPRVCSTDASLGEEILNRSRSFRRLRLPGQNTHR